MYIQYGNKKNLLRRTGVGVGYLPSHLKESIAKTALQIRSNRFQQNKDVFKINVFLKLPDVQLKATKLYQSTADTLS